VNLIVVLSGHNEFLKMNAPYEPQLMLNYFHNHFSSIRFYHYFIKLFIQKVSSKTRYFQKNLQQTNRVFENYDKNIDHIIKLAQQADIPLFLCTVPANLLWPPTYDFKYLFVEEISEICYKLLDDKFNYKELGELESKATGLLKGYKTNVLALYTLGMIEYRKRNFKKAYYYLNKSKDYDNRPLRVISKFNETIRNRTITHGVTVIDVEQRFKEESYGNIIGFDLIADNCHPTPRGNFIIASLLLEAMVERNIIKTNGNYDILKPKLSNILEDVGWYKNRSPVRSKYLNNCIEYCGSFRNMYAVKMYCEEILKIDPENKDIRNKIEIIENNFQKGVSEIDRYLRN